MELIGAGTHGNVFSPSVLKDRQNFTEAGSGNETVVMKLFAEVDKKEQSVSLLLMRRFFRRRKKI